MKYLILLSCSFLWSVHAIAQEPLCDCATCKEIFAEDAAPEKVKQLSAPHDDHDGHDHSAHATEEAPHDDHAVHDHSGCDHDAAETAHDDHAGHDHSGHDHADHAGEGAIVLSKENAAKVGITLKAATGGMMSSTSIFPAEIKLNKDQSAAVSPRYSSVVREVFVEMGDQVKKGDVLASLENRSTMATYTVSAPLSGLVVSKNTSVGEAANEDKVLFEVADLSTVWADISIFPRFQHAIRKGMPAEFIAHDGHVAHGTVKYLSPLVSKETRTFTARCVLTGADEDFTPGAFVRARITIASNAVPVRIERGAVQRVEGEDMVFVPTEHGFESRVVTTGISDAHFIEIRSGLRAGETYVATAAFSLKAEMITSGLDPHAGHGH